MPREAPPGWRVIEHAGNEIDARLIAGHLEEAGIRVVLEKDQSGYGDYLYGGGNPNAPVILLVPEEQWEVATAVLDDAAIEPGSISDDPSADPLPSSVDSMEDLGTTGDDLYVRRAVPDEQVMAAPVRSGLRWVLVILTVLVVVIAASESGFFSDLIGV